jgi:hypothetical protein
MSALTANCNGLCFNIVGSGGLLCDSASVALSFVAALCLSLCDSGLYENSVLQHQGPRTVFQQQGPWTVFQQSGASDCVSATGTSDCVSAIRGFRLCNGSVFQHLRPGLCFIGRDFRLCNGSVFQQQALNASLQSNQWLSTKVM